MHKLTTISVKHNIWGNYNCMVGTTKDISTGNEWEALEWLSEKLATGLYRISDKSDISLDRVKEHEMRIARTNTRMG